MLNMDSEAPLGYEQFMELCRTHMSRKDYKELESAVFAAKGDPKSPLMKRWQDFVKRVEAALVSERSRKLGWPEEDVLYEGDQVLLERIRRAVTGMNPLEGEMEILGIYFDFLSRCESFDPFSRDSLMIYALKLQLLEKKNSFKKEKGESEFERLFRELQKEFVVKEG